MFRLYNVAIFRELHVWSTCKEYLAIVWLVGGEIFNLYSVRSSSSALHPRIMIQQYQRAWIHSLQFVCLLKLKQFRTVIPASQFLSLSAYATYGLWYMFLMRVAPCFVALWIFFSFTHLQYNVVFQRKHLSILCASKLQFAVIINTQPIFFDIKRPHWL
jgi:hypothetical protein